MNYILKSSLEHIAVAKLAAVLWNQFDIRELMLRFSVQLHDVKERTVKEWLKIEDRVKQKVPLIPLPGLLKEKILNFIKPVGIQILKWIEYNHKANLHLVLLPLEFSWTSHGTLDKKRTAEFLIKDETIDIRVRYKLACIYCLENDVRNLWNRMNENCRENFDNENQEELVNFWTCDVKGELGMMRKKVKRPHAEFALKRTLNYTCSPYQYAFEYAADNLNNVAVEYFYHKLTIREREESLVPTAVSVALFVPKYCFESPKVTSDFLRENYSDVLCFLLSKLSYEQQTEIFKRFHFQVLICLLHFPWQVFFMETASMMWSFLFPVVYEVLLSQIACKIVDGHKYFNYQEMFRKYWEQSPDTFKRYAVKECFSFPNSLFAIFFKSRDVNNLKFIFSYATLQEKKELICDSHGQDICTDLMDRDEWGLLEYFIKECLSSKDDMIEFKKCFLKYGKENLLNVSFAIKKGWHKGLELLNDIINDFDKRKFSEENDLNKSKKLCIS